MGIEPNDGEDQMNEKDDDIAHPRMVSKSGRTPDFGQFRNSPCTPFGLRANSCSHLAVPYLLGISLVVAIFEDC
jgi:hypothetical protein